MKPLLPPIIIFAGGYAPNVSERDWMKRKLQKRGIPFKEVKGHWQSKEEYSFITHAEHSSEVQKLLVRAGQSFYVYSDEERNTELWNSHGVKLSNLGTLTRVDSPLSSYYTLDPSTGYVWETL